jgi:hypothetical protein
LSFRIWFILPNRQSADAMQAGSSGTPNMLKESMTDYATAPYLLSPKSPPGSRRWRRRIHSLCLLVPADQRLVDRRSHGVASK